MNNEKTVWEEFDKADLSDGMDVDWTKVKAFIRSHFVSKDALMAIWNAAPEEMGFEELAQTTKKMLALLNEQTP